jgi:cephalosporin hydroxylase
MNPGSLGTLSTTTKEECNAASSQSHDSACQEDLIMSTQAIDDFHRLYYNSRVWQNTRWLGVPTAKFPADLWIYQEILWETQPELIIECGTYAGGTAYFIACLLDVIATGNIFTIDTCFVPNRPRHRRIRYFQGGSTEPRTVEEVRSWASQHGKVMVILDSDHSQTHVARELELYAPLVSAGCYLIVEDTNVNGHPVSPTHGPGPAEAIWEFLPTHPEFTVDRSREKFL